MGTQRTLEVLIDVALHAGEMGGPMPTMALQMTLAVTAVQPGGDMTLRATIDRITARDTPRSTVPASALEGPLAALEGLALDATLSPSGRLRGAKVDRGSRSLPAAVETQLAALVTSFEQTMMPLPVEAVGPSAVWRSSRAIVQNGVQLTAVNTLTLTNTDGTTFEFTVDTDIHGADQAVTLGESKIAIKDIVGTGGGKGTIDLATLAVTSEIGAELRSEMTAETDTSPTSMRMTTLTRVQPLPR